MGGYLYKPYKPFYKPYIDLQKPYKNVCEPIKTYTNPTKAYNNLLSTSLHTVLGKKDPPGGFLAITRDPGHLLVPG